MLTKIKNLYEKNKEIVAYIFWGGCTTLISIFSFAVCYKLFCMHELIANIVSWILAVTFAYVTNRIWVFKSSAKSRDMVNEILLFFSSRLITLLLEEFIIVIFTVWLLFDGLLVKIFGQFIVLITNYLISKFITFKKR